MAKKKVDTEEVVVNEVAEVEVANTEKDALLALYAELNRRGIRSISDLENQIARA